MHIQFKKRSNSAKDTAILFATQSVIISGTDSVISVVGAQKELLLPVDVNSQANSTTFIFHRLSTDNVTVVSDTLEIGYTKQSKLVSKDCGAYTYYQNLTILKTSKSLESSQFKTFSTSLIKDPTASLITSYAINYQILY
ncbi:hypothetical protein WSM22_07350 [Cytophagales bacterium WSM2-2]|nr:hypothetical protein WSM22_07350 [Cytophagales bacterium WSM2-2]